MKEATITLEQHNVTFSVKHNLHLNGQEIEKIVNHWECVTLSPTSDDFCLFVKCEYPNDDIICEPVK